MFSAGYTIWKNGTAQGAPRLVERPCFSMFGRKCSELLGKTCFFWSSPTFGVKVEQKSQKCNGPRAHNVNSALYIVVLLLHAYIVVAQPNKKLANTTQKNAYR